MHQLVIDLVLRRQRRAGIGALAHHDDGDAAARRQRLARLRHFEAEHEIFDIAGQIAGADIGTFAMSSQLFAVSAMLCAWAMTFCCCGGVAPDGTGRTISTSESWVSSVLVCPGVRRSMR